MIASLLAHVRVNSRPPLHPRLYSTPFPRVVVSSLVVSTLQTSKSKPERIPWDSNPPYFLPHVETTFANARNGKRDKRPPACTLQEKPHQLYHPSFLPLPFARKFRNIEAVKVEATTFSCCSVLYREAFLFLVPRESLNFSLVNLSLFLKKKRENF